MTNQNPMSGLELIKNPLWVEASHWRHLQENKSGPARQALFEQYLPFAKKIAADNYYRRRRDNFELGDVEQWAVEAVLVSIDRYKPHRGVPFTAFARRRILGNIADGIAGMSEVGRQSRYAYQAEKDRLQSLKAGNGENKEDALSELRELTVGLALGMMLEGTSLFVDAGQSTSLPNGYDSLVWKDMVKKLNTELDRLPDPQPFIIRQHYQNDISFSQIAKLLGRSKGRISQLHHQALKLLRMRVGKI